MDSQGTASGFEALRHRLAILPRHLGLLSLALMVGIIAASGYLLDQAWQHAKRDQEQAAWNLALAASDNFNSEVAQLNAQLQAVADASGGDADPALLKTRLTEALRLTSGKVYALLGVDAQGQVTFTTTDQIPPGTDLSALDAIKTATSTQAVAIGPPINVDGDQYLTMAAPIHQPGAPDHIGLSLLRLSYFQKNLLISGIDPGGVLALFEIGGPEILRNPPAPAGSDLLAAGQALTRMLGDADNASSVDVSKLDQIPRLSVVVRAGALHVGVLVAVPMAVLWQNWWPQAIAIIAITLILLAMMVAFDLALGAELIRRREAEAKSDHNVGQYQLLAEHSSDVIMEVGFDKRCRYVSPAMEQLLGWTSADLIGRDTRFMVHPDDKVRLHDVVMSLTDTTRSVRTDFRHLHKNGKYVWVEINMRVIIRGGVLDSFVANLRDISGRVEAERRLAEASAVLVQLAGTDQLTGLANRQRFADEIEREWSRAARDKNPLSLLFIDIDFFKLYNETYGRKGGDNALKAVAGAIAAVLQRASDLAARWGGQKFGVLLPNTDLTGAMGVAEHLRAAVEALDLPHRVTPRGRLNVSIGVATAYPVLHQVPKPLIDEANANLSEAQRLGRNRVVAQYTEADASVDFRLPSGSK